MTSLTAADVATECPQVLEPPFDTAVWTFKALSDPSRLKILAHLARQDAYPCASSAGVCACDLESVTGLTQPTVSHHMKCLVSAQLVAGEKRGKWMYYRIDPAGFSLVKSLLPLTTPSLSRRSTRS